MQRIAHFSIVWSLIALAAVAAIVVGGCGPQVDPVSVEEANAKLLVQNCPGAVVEDSLLISRANEAGIKLEDIHNLILDAAAIAMLVSEGKVSTEDIHWVCDQIETYLLRDTISYSALIGLITDDVQQVRLIGGIVERHLPLFDSGFVVRECDRKLTKASIDDIRAWYPL